MPIDPLIGAAAFVGVGLITKDDDDGLFARPGDTPLDIYDDYIIENRYYKDGATYMLGVTDPGGFFGAAASFVQLAKPTVLWVADWTAARSHHPPEIPSAFGIQRRVLEAAGVSANDDNGGPTDWGLMDQHVGMRHIELAPDGVTPTYRISGVYVFGALNPDENLLKDAYYPRPAWMKRDGRVQRRHNGDFVADGLLKP